MYVSLETNTHSLNDKSTQSPPGISDMNISELNVGALIKNARQKKGLSQKDLAKRCGITLFNYAALKIMSVFLQKKHFKCSLDISVYHTPHLSLKPVITACPEKMFITKQMELN
jgi:hypothetical protein